jgi:membrane protein
MNTVARFTKETFLEWLRTQSNLLAGGLAYFALLSFGPLLVILLRILDLVTTRQAVAEELILFMGNRPAESLFAWVDASHRGGHRLLTVASLLLLYFGATRVFTTLQASLNIVFNARVPRQAFWKRWLLRRTLLPSTLILAAGVVIAAFIAFDFGVHALAVGASSSLPIVDHVRLLRFASFCASVLILGLLFAGLFRWVPHATYSWRVLLPGAFFTSLLFAIARYLLARYMDARFVGSLYGAIGSGVVLMLWTYVACQIFFFGAVFTTQLARLLGLPVLRWDGEGERIDQRMALGER